MKSKYIKMFSDEERQLKGKLDVLFKEWKKSVGEPENCWFVPDGFYPNYLSQRPRILYIGRDSYCLYGTDDENGEKTYIEKFIRQYVEGVMDKGRSIDRIKFHKMLIKVAYGLIHERTWRKIPHASEICAGGRVFEKMSFAFMNLCKWSHDWSNEKSGDDSTGWAADWGSINRFVDLSVTEKRNFIFEEIGLLEPDVIIAMNFGKERIQQLFDVGEPIEKRADCYVYPLTISKKCLLLDPWHFSATNKSEDKNIYAPLSRMSKKYKRCYM